MESASLGSQQNLQDAQGEYYRMALRQLDAALWEYDAATATVCPLDQVAREFGEKYGLSEKMTGMPDALLHCDFLLPGSVQELQRLFSSLRQGVASAAAELRVSCPGEVVRWLRLVCHTVAQGAAGQPLRVIALVQDITGEKELEGRCIRELRYFDMMVSDAIGLYEANLTKDQMLMMDEGWVNGLGRLGVTSYTLLVRNTCNERVHPAYRHHMWEGLQRKTLLRCFEEGCTEVSCEYRRTDRQGRMIWVRCVVHMIRSAENGDVCAFFYLKNIEAEKNRELELRRRAETDPLTGLYNRAASVARIEQLLREDDRHVSALLMMDVDNFKQVNDTYGHAYGDTVLRGIAEKLHATFRRGDVLGRLGGDEFIAFLSGLPGEALAEEKARQLCSQLGEFQAADWLEPVSCSIGIAFSPRQGANFALLYEHADTALYKAKLQGKNQCAVYEEGLTLEGWRTHTPIENSSDLSSVAPEDEAVPEAGVKSL